MMKKLISLAMTLAMLCCMATTAFAVTDNIVGERPLAGDGTYADGADAINNNNKSYEVQISVSSNTTKHKYAVDVTYDASALAIGGSTLTWDVNTMKYVVTDMQGGADSTDPKTKALTITNYSDLPIKAYAEIALVDQYNDAPLNLASTNDSTNKLTIAAATPGTVSTNGQAKTETITVSLDPSNDAAWSAVSAYLADKGATGDVVIAKATVTIEAA